MKRALTFLVPASAVPGDRSLRHGSAKAAAGETKAETTTETKAEEGNLAPWKWANFLVLAGLLGYLAGKHGGPFFAARSQEVSARTWPKPRNLRQEAEARAAAVERRLANLEADIAALRAEAQRGGAGRNRAHARSRPPPKSPRSRPTPNRKSPPPARPPAWI